MNINNIKMNYLEAKRILEIASSGDDVRKDVREALTLENVIKLHYFIKECEDSGIHLISKTSN